MPELPDHLKTPGHRRAESEQQRLVGDVQFHLRERGVDVTDRDVWLHGVNHGPFADTESWAGSVLAVLDPMREGRFRLTDWPGVSNVVGLVLPAPEPSS